MWYIRIFGLHKEGSNGMDKVGEDTGPNRPSVRTCLSSTVLMVCARNLYIGNKRYLSKKLL